jgi:hypothetical protein
MQNAERDAANGSRGVKPRELVGFVARHTVVIANGND